MLFSIEVKIIEATMSNKTTQDIRLYKKKCIDDGVLRHPVDAQEWKEFDRIHESFAQEPHNVRLKLVSDCFNPFRI